MLLTTWRQARLYYWSTNKQNFSDNCILGTIIMFAGHASVIRIWIKSPDILCQGVGVDSLAWDNFMTDCSFIPRPIVHHTQCAQSCTHLIASLIPRPSHCPVFDRLPVHRNRDPPTSVYLGRSSLPCHVAKCREQTYRYHYKLFLTNQTNSITDAAT